MKRSKKQVKSSSPVSMPAPQSPSKPSTEQTATQILNSLEQTEELFPSPKNGSKPMRSDTESYLSDDLRRQEIASSRRLLIRTMLMAESILYSINQNPT